jgi:uncharacterized RDD family membrane protein YckC
MNAAASNPHAAIRFDSLVGGEAVPIDLRVARIGSRSVAFTLDLIIEIIAVSLLLAVLGALNLEPAAALSLAVAFIVLVFFGYPTVLEAAWGGRTLGKAAMGLRATRDDGGPLRFRHALVRSLTRYLVDGFPALLGLIGVISMLVSSRGKRIGDVLAGTLVLQSRVPHLAGQVAPMPAPLAGWATTLDLSRMPDALALQCRQFLGRVGQLTPDARERLGASLVAAVASTVTPLPPPGTPGWAYISAVLAERRRREELRMQVVPPPGYGQPPSYGPPTGYGPPAGYAPPGYAPPPIPQAFVPPTPDDPAPPPTTHPDGGFVPPM